MSHDNLALYLNDHLAGGVAAIRLLEQLEERSLDARFSASLGDVRAEVVEDHHLLAAFLRSLGISESGPRKLAARLGQKLSRLKLRLEASDEGELQLLHALDLLALGVTGKRALWEALAEAAELDPELASLDYATLLRRADRQLTLLRDLRLEAARRALPRLAGEAVVAH